MTSRFTGGFSRGMPTATILTSLCALWPVRVPLHTRNNPYVLLRTYPYEPGGGRASTIARRLLRRTNATLHGRPALLRVACRAGPGRGCNRACNVSSRVQPVAFCNTARRLCSGTRCQRRERVAPRCLRRAPHCIALHHVATRCTGVADSGARGCPLCTATLAIHSFG